MKPVFRRLWQAAALTVGVAASTLVMAWCLMLVVSVLGELATFGLLLFLCIFMILMIYENWWKPDA